MAELQKKRIAAVRERNMKIFGNDYCTIVAETQEQAEKLFEEELGDLPEDGLRAVDGSKRKMWFPIDELPERYHDETKHPRRDWHGEYTGVEITLSEAMRFRKDKPPYMLSVSSDLV
mgnify:CR=1 FL=1